MQAIVRLQSRKLDNQSLDYYIMALTVTLMKLNVMKVVAIYKSAKAHCIGLPSNYIYSYLL